MKFRVEFTLPEQGDDAFETLAFSPQRAWRFQRVIEAGFPFAYGIVVTYAERIDDKPRMAPHAYTYDEAYAKMNACRQAFIQSTNLVRDHLAGLVTLEDVRYEIMRANAVVAQGMIWAEMLLIDPTGWLDRMFEINHLWGQVK